MTANDGDAEVSARDQLSNLQGLLVISMLMTESSDEERIVHLATTSVPSLGRCRLDGVYLRDDGWQAVEGGRLSSDVRVDIEAQFAAIGSAGGALSIAA